MPTPTTRPRIRGLQDVRHGTQQSPLDVLNQLVQLQREKARITQEKQNWQAKVTLIETRLEEIAAREKKLQPFLAAEDGAGDAGAEPAKQSREVSAYQEQSHAAAVDTVTIRY